jgi:hypothetical protein
MRPLIGSGSFAAAAPAYFEESGYAQAYVYGVVDAPLPMSDRDTVVRFDYAQDPQTKDITVTITNFPDFIAPLPRTSGCLQWAAIGA